MGKLFLRIQSIWKDPVWSKVIANAIWATAFAGAGTFCLYISKNSLKEFFLQKIEFYWLILLLISGFLLNKLKHVKKNKGEQPTAEQSIIQKLKVNSYKVDSGNENIYWKWDMVFHEGLKFSIENVTPYCTKHEPMMKLVEDGFRLGCPICNVVGTNRAQANNIANIVASLVEADIEKLLNA